MGDGQLQQPQAKPHKNLPEHLPDKDENPLNVPFPVLALTVRKQPQHRGPKRVHPR